MDTTKTKRNKRTRRHSRVRAKVFGTSVRPRLSVFRSNRFVSAQLIDDEKRNTIVGLSSKGIGKSGNAGAKETGLKLAQEAKKKKVTEVVFDRGGFLFTGNVKALAEGAREGGLKF